MRDQHLHSLFAQLRDFRVLSHILAVRPKQALRLVLAVAGARIMCERAAGGEGEGCCEGEQAHKGFETVALRRSPHRARGRFPDVATPLIGAASDIVLTRLLEPVLS